MHSFQFEAIGTNWQIDVHTLFKTSRLSIVKKAILTRIEEFDKTYSRFRDDSWVRKNSYKITNDSVPSDFDEMFALYQMLYRASNGLFTPLIGSTLEQAGYDKNYSLTPSTLTAPPPLEEAVEYADNEIHFKQKVLLDFGAAGKGYLVDIVDDILQQFSMVDFTIDASGDISHKSSSTTPIRIGLEHPDEIGIAIGVCELLNKSICGSAGNKRKWASFHHTINPHTLSSPQDIRATWVVADSTLLADALATCLFLDPEPDHYKDFKFEYVLLYKDNMVRQSDNFPGQLFTTS